MTRLKYMSIAMIALLLGLGRVSAAKEKDKTDLIAAAEATVAKYESVDPGIRQILKDSPGYAVFPKIAKGGFIIGGAGGDGVVFSNGKAIGKVKMGQGSIGAQIGGQTYAELIVFETPDVLTRFKTSDMTFTAQVSAVALKSGVSANAKYTDGVMVITHSESGFMAEAAIGGQKFKYEPFAQPIPTG